MYDIGIGHKKVVWCCSGVNTWWFVDPVSDDHRIETAHHLSDGSASWVFTPCKPTRLHVTASRRRCLLMSVFWLCQTFFSTRCS